MRKNTTTSNPHQKGKRLTLCQAVAEGLLDEVQWWLSDGGASITEADSDGRTALLLAAYAGQLDVMQWLM